MVFTHTWPVTTDGSDSRGRMTLPYLCKLLQETATFHADLLGWGVDVLKENNLQWVLSRQWIRIDRMPGWKENVTVATWPSAQRGISWNRDFRLTDSDGAPIGIATSLWFVMDRETRRPRPAQVGPAMPVEGAERVRDAELKALPALMEPAPAGSVTAAWHDIDYHQHVNNIKYLTWMINGLENAFLADYVAAEVEINFLQEGFLGDVLNVKTDDSTGAGRDFLQNLTRESDGAELCRMKTRWRPS